MRFKLWLERHFITLPPHIQQDINSITAPISPTQNAIIGQIQINSNWSIKIQVKDIKAGGAYDPRANIIYVNPLTAQNPDALKEILHHELTHLVDPETGKMIKNDLLHNTRADLGTDRYYKQRAEFNAYGSQLAHYISQKLAQMNIQQRQQTIIDLNNWLRQGRNTFPGFVGKVATFLGVGSSMPSIISPFWKIQRAWKQDPDLWKQFKQKLYSLLQQEETNRQIQSRQAIGARPKW